MKAQLTTRNRIYIPGITMLTAEETGEALQTTPEKIHQFRRCGLLNAIKTGKNWMFSQNEIIAFQNKMVGKDLSNLAAIENVVKRSELRID